MSRLTVHIARDTGTAPVRDMIIPSPGRAEHILQPVEHPVNAIPACAPGTRHIQSGTQLGSAWDYRRDQQDQVQSPRDEPDAQGVVNERCRKDRVGRRVADGRWHLVPRSLRGYVPGTSHREGEW